MSDTEVTVTKSESGSWYRMEFRGKYDFLETEPTEHDKSEFKKSVTYAAAMARAQAAIPKNGRGGVQIKEMK